MENLDYSDFFSSFNNAFGLGPKDHKSNGNNHSDVYSEQSDDTSYIGFVDDLVKAFSKCSPSKNTQGLSRDYDVATYPMMPYIFRDNSHLSMTRIRSASAPIPIAKLNAAKCLFSRYEKKRSSCRSRSDSLSSLKQSSLSLSLSDYQSDDEVFLDEEDDEVVMVTNSALVPRERAMTAPLQ